MTEPDKDADLLQGQCVAFTGRLASMTRAEAADLVASYGGRFVATVSRRTALLVVGQEGWPLRKDGRLTHNLRSARLLQRQGHPIALLTEEELLARLSLESRSEDIRRLYTTMELSRILQISPDRLRAWTQAGFICPASTDHGICYFDFRQVSGAKTLSDLVRAGVTKDRLQRSLRQLRAWLPDIEQPLAQLAFLGDKSQLLVRLESGQLAEPTGQLVFDFEETESETGGKILSTQTPTSDDCFELGCQEEAAGRLPEAIHSYRQALLLGGPDAETCFNLANALYALGDKKQASERFYQAVELKPDFTQAWNNLGTVFAELGRSKEALAAYRRALELDPGYADAHFNLAELLDEIGQAAAACRHWRAYAEQDPHSEWGRYAHRQLSTKRGPSQNRG